MNVKHIFLKGLTQDQATVYRAARVLAAERGTSAKAMIFTALAEYVRRRGRGGLLAAAHESQAEEESGP